MLSQFANFASEDMNHEQRVFAFLNADALVGIEKQEYYIKTSLRRKRIDESRSWVRRKIIFSSAVTDIELGGLSHPEPFDLSWFFILTENMPHKDRTLLYRRFVLGMKEKELAELYGVPLGTIKSRSSRACEKLKGTQ